MYGEKTFTISIIAFMVVLRVVGCTKANSVTGVSDGWKLNGTLMIVVAYKAESGTDNAANILTPYAEKYIGQTSVTGNKEGGSGFIGWSTLAKAKGDGLTSGFINLPAFVSNIIDGLARAQLNLSNRLQITYTIIVTVK